MTIEEIAKELHKLSMTLPDNTEAPGQKIRCAALLLLSVINGDPSDWGVDMPNVSIKVYIKRKRSATTVWHGKH